VYLYMCRVGQNCIYTPYMTVYLVISLQIIPYIHRIYMVLANPIYVSFLCVYLLSSQGKGDFWGGGRECVVADKPGQSIEAAGKEAGH
jgi:hypothetical protein